MSSSTGARDIRTPAWLFVIDLDGAIIGMVTLDRHDAESPGHASELALPLGYVRRRPIAM